MDLSTGLPSSPCEYSRIFANLLSTLREVSRTEQHPPPPCTISRLKAHRRRSQHVRIGAIPSISSARPDRARLHGRRRRCARPAQASAAGAGAAVDRGVVAGRRRESGASRVLRRMGGTAGRARRLADGRQQVPPYTPRPRRARPPRRPLRLRRRRVRQLPW
jgi:hypothetical protein